MMDATWIMLPVVAALALAVGYLFHKAATDRRIGGAEREARHIVETAERDAETRRKAADLEMRESTLKARGALDAETRRHEREMQSVEQRILAKEEELARKLEQIERRLAEYTDKEKGLATRERTVSESERRLASALDEQRHKLEAIAGLTAEEAKRQLLAQMEAEARREAQLVAMRLEEESRETARDKAKEILATTIQRLAPDYTVETAVSVVDLPSDDMKGRIIGREGRNIRALELHTGVDLIVDDTPEAVLISAYDPYRREIARLALQRLVADGRIHPARIEEVVNKVKQEMEVHLKEEGDKACFEVGVHGLHPELVKLVGRMKYRTSYGQNCLQHSKEVAWLAGMMAAEVKGDVKLAKRMGLLHDIGKALTHEQEGSHPELSLQVLTKYNE
ncbi:MAG TPA: ribonuclease Y, partial [Solirubrobacterales bacterium]|nr:ribonuclease Y [Solirubrobacterales bacterium]